MLNPAKPIGTGAYQAEAFDEPRQQAGVLETKDLSRAVGARLLVDDISTDVRPSEVLAIIGRSGAGKSSLLRLLNRLDEPTSGTVLFNGRDYRQIAPPEPRCRVGMLMQTAYLFPSKVAANIAFGPRQRGQNLDSARVAELLERVGL